MLLTLRSRGVHFDAQTRARIKNLIRVALGRYAGRISSVKVYVAALQGPGNDLGCRIVVKPNRADQSIVATGRHADIIPLVEQTANHAGKAVRRRLRRARTRRIRSLRQSVASSAI